MASKKKSVDNERKPLPKVDAASLSDAIVEGKFLAEVEERLIVERLRDGKMKKSLCIVKKIEGDNVHAWDDTRDQWFIFNVAGIEKHGIVMKRIKRTS